MIKVPTVDLSNDCPLIKEWFRVTLYQCVDEARVAFGMEPSDLDYIGQLYDLYKSMSAQQQYRADEITLEWCVANYEDYIANAQSYNRFKAVYEEKYKDNPPRIIME